MDSEQIAAARQVDTLIELMRRRQRYLLALIIIMVVIGATNLAVLAVYLTRYGTSACDQP